MIAHDRSHASRLLCIDCPIWARFKASGEQDLDGFDDVDEVQGEEEDEDEDMPDDDDDDGDEAAAAKSMAELDAAEQELEGEEGPVDAFTGFAPRLLPAPRPRLLPLQLRIQVRQRPILCLISHIIPKALSNLIKSRHLLTLKRIQWK